jgi:FMN phosphatase YigB (HAD superfamily)
MGRVIKAVCFDVGETLVNETRLWDSWADWLGISREDFHAELREVITARQSHRRVFDRFRPAFDLARERVARESAGWTPDHFNATDLYPDALPCLAQLRAEGYRLAIAGNQRAATEAVLHEIGIDVDVLASSESWGIEKPSPLFFRKLAEQLGHGADEIAYVGDRLDNDIIPALDAGMTAIFIERGPWGAVHRKWPELSRTSASIRSLLELPGMLRKIQDRTGGV